MPRPIRPRSLEERLPPPNPPGWRPPCAVQIGGVVLLIAAVVYGFRSYHEWAWQQQLAAESAVASEKVAFGTRFAELKKLADRLAPPLPDDADAPDVPGGAVRGKALVLASPDDPDRRSTTAVLCLPATYDLDRLHERLPDEIGARSPAEAKTLVRVQRRFRLVGHYVRVEASPTPTIVPAFLDRPTPAPTPRPATTNVTTVTVIDVAAEKVVARRTFLGDPPLREIEGGDTRWKDRMVPDGKLLGWLRGLPRVP